MGELTGMIIYVTSVNMVQAEKIAGELLSQRKAACVNIIPGIESRYWWRGKIASAKECLLIVKSSSELLDEIVQIVKKAHTYDVPEIIAVPIVAGSADYLQWLHAEVHR
jgi:periplasmic divalent cation tolerance protein